jgi:hypothetical protein
LHPDALHRDANFDVVILANMKPSDTLEIDKRTGICREWMLLRQLAWAERHARRFDQAIKK